MPLMLRRLSDWCACLSIRRAHDHASCRLFYDRSEHRDAVPLADECSTYIRALPILSVMRVGGWFDDLAGGVEFVIYGLALTADIELPVVAHDDESGAFWVPCPIVSIAELRCDFHVGTVRGVAGVATHRWESGRRGGFSPPSPHCAGRPWRVAVAGWSAGAAVAWRVMALWAL